MNPFSNASAILTGIAISLASTSWIGYQVGWKDGYAGGLETAFPAARSEGRTRMIAVHNEVKKYPLDHIKLATMTCEFASGLWEHDTEEDIERRQHDLIYKGYCVGLDRVILTPLQKLLRERDCRKKGLYWDVAAGYCVREK